VQRNFASKAARILYF